MTTTDNLFFASISAGLEPLLATELATIGVSEIRQTGSGVTFRGGLRAGYLACLHSRLASRILMTLATGKATSDSELYNFVKTIDWSDHLTPSHTLAVNFYCRDSNITHSQYGALKVKDAIVDQIRERTGSRPSVDRDKPDVRINVYLFRNRARVALDLSGDSLHRRGYRQQGAQAPLRENLAAALLLASDWPAIATQGGSFVDPMCGSGTLLIEAALIATQTAPGLLRDYFGFNNWLGHDNKLWESLVAQARDKDLRSVGISVSLSGFDRDGRAIAAARQNLARAGLNSLAQLDIQQQSIAKLSSSLADASVQPGLLLSNLPYGQRVGEQRELGRLYSLVGQSISEACAGWRVSLFTAAQGLIHRTRLPVKSVLTVDNGGIRCRLFHGALPTAASSNKDRKPGSDTASVTVENSDTTRSSGIDVSMFVNRLQKRHRQLAKWQRRNAIAAWRLYDADIPEFAVAVDIYDCSERHVVVHEYQAPSRVDKQVARDRLAAVVACLPEVLDCQPQHVYLKVRKRQSGDAQYQRLGESATEHVVEEAGCRLLVNFKDYLDTGLFLDHRPVRRYIQQEAAGKRFLNLFAYTASATVHAFRGGASESVSVDMSNTYCRWAERNLALNGADAQQHRVLRADCLEWLRDPADSGFDLILLDPPTFSNSARMTESFDIQRQHQELIRLTMPLLAPGGGLIFSTNHRRFKLDKELHQDFAIEDRSRWSIDPDFERNARIHQCWFITARV